MTTKNEGENLLKFAWGMDDDELAKLSEKEQYEIADNLLGMTLHQISRLLPKTEIWHTGCTELNVWQAGRMEEMDRCVHFNKGTSRKEKEQILDIMEEPRGKKK